MHFNGTTSGLDNAKQSLEAQIVCKACKLMCNCTGSSSGLDVPKGSAEGPIVCLTCKLLCGCKLAK